MHLSFVMFVTGQGRSVKVPPPPPPTPPSRTTVDLYLTLILLSYTIVRVTFVVSRKCTTLCNIGTKRYLETKFQMTEIQNVSDL